MGAIHKLPQEAPSDGLKVNSIQQEQGRRGRRLVNYDTELTAILHALRTRVSWTFEATGLAKPATWIKSFAKRNSAY